MRSPVMIIVLVTSLVTIGITEVDGFPSSWGARGSQKFWLAGVIVNSYVQIGYQEVSANTSLPILLQGVVPVNNQILLGTMEIMMKNIRFWSGTIGVATELTPMI